MEKALSLDDINNITGLNSKMLTYPQLQKFKNIFDIFNYIKDDNFILLYQTAENFGHWCLCFIRPNIKNIEIEFYDPYGEEIDKNLSCMKSYYNKQKYKNNYIYYPHLTRLILNTPNNIKIHYNNYKHQQYKQGIATCGRHVAWRLKHYYMNIDDYSRKFGKKYIDKDIVKHTNKYLI